MIKLIMLPEQKEVSRQIDFKSDDGVNTASIRYIGEAFWSKDWVNKIGATLDDDGSNFTLRLGKKRITLDYGEAFDTMILLSEMFKKLEPNSKPPYEVYVRE